MDREISNDGSRVPETKMSWLDMTMVTTTMMMVKMVVVVVVVAVVVAVVVMMIMMMAVIMRQWYDGGGRDGGRGYRGGCGGGSGCIGGDICYVAVGDSGAICYIHGDGYDSRICDENDHVVCWVKLTVNRVPYCCCFGLCRRTRVRSRPPRNDWSIHSKDQLQPSGLSVCFSSFDIRSLSTPHVTLGPLCCFRSPQAEPYSQAILTFK